MKPRLILLACLVTHLMLTSAAAQDQVVSRRYSDDGLLRRFGANIILRGSPKQIMKLTGWLDQISLVPQGFLTLQKIDDSNHDLIIQHSDIARISAGRTRGPMTMNLINGVGDNVQIIFDTRMKDRGTHMVYNKKNELIEYTAVQNLYHELAHAMHMMNGTWLYFASERQAIKEENIFRLQLAELQGRVATQRFRKNGVPISDLEHSVAAFDNESVP